MHIRPISSVNISTKTPLKKQEHGAKTSASSTGESAHNYQSQNLAFCSAMLPKKRKKTFNTRALYKLNIPNLRTTSENGVRGESLSAKRNRHFIPNVAKAGIKNVIDLRTSDHTDLFEKLCGKEGMRCFHIPIDADTTPTKDIIKSLPTFFNLINKGNFYIACAQGLHRTDIALSLNYLLNPKASAVPPQLIGHIKDGGLRFSDIFTRTNDVYRNLTNEDKIALGWDEKFDENFRVRKVNLIKVQNLDKK